MKNLIVLCLFLISYVADANIFRCNNDPTVPVSATLKRTLQEAHDFASDGDIIYVEPSYGGTSYGGLNMTKTLTIIGNGYDHAINPGPTQNWDLRTSLVGTINIIGSVGFNTAGQGSILMGLNFNGNYLTIKVPNVTVKRCKNTNIFLIREADRDPSGATIAQNFNTTVYGTGFSTYASNCYTPYPVENVTIKNNINLYYVANTISSGCINISTIAGSNNYLIANNIISSSTNLNNCSSCIIQNNIFRNIPLSGIIGGIGTGSVIGNNVCSTGPCVQGSNNIDSAVESHLFVVAVPSGNDKDFILKVGSVAIGAGLGGVDAGAFGTTSPYVLSGLAPIPQITAYSLNSSAGVYTISTPMTVILSIKGNN